MRDPHRPKHVNRMLLASVTSMIFILTACGSTQGSGSSASQTSSSSEAASSSATDQVVTSATTVADAALKLSTAPLPSVATTPPKGINLWIISCLQAADGCSLASAGAEEAAKALGWKVTLFDGKGDPAVYADGVRQAIADSANVIMPVVIDCGTIKAPLQEAKRDGIYVYGLLGIDCTDPSQGGGQSLFDGQASYGSYAKNYVEFGQKLGQLKADYIISRMNGHAKVIEFRGDDLAIVKIIMDAFEKELATCAACEVVDKVNFTLADLGPPLTAKAQAALLAHPEADVIQTPYGDAATWVSTAVQSSAAGRNLLVGGGDGHPHDCQMLENGQLNFTTAYSLQQSGWAAVDDTIRALNKEPVLDSGIRAGLMDQNNIHCNVAGYFGTTEDYAGNYRNLWGLQ